MKILVIITSIVIFASCSDRSERISSIQNNQTINNEVIGKKITFATHLFALNNNLKFPNRITKPIILTTVGTDCAACVEKFMNWTNFDIKQLSDYEIIFVAMGTKTPLIEHYLKEDDKRRFTILLDTTGRFVADNGIYNYYQRTLILDKNKAVIYVGDPVKDEIVLNDLRYLANEK